MKRVAVTYYAALRDLLGVTSEEVSTSAADVAALWVDVCTRRGASLDRDQIRVAIDDVFVSWSASLPDKSCVAFMPPFAGG